MNHLFKLFLRTKISAPTTIIKRKIKEILMSSSSFSAFTNMPSSSEGGLTRDEFYAFHKIDRTLFTRLVFGLNRDMNQTSHVIAFLFLLEQIGHARNLIAYLVSLPDVFIDALANEVCVCLSILHNQDYYSRFFVANINNDDESVIPLLKRLTGDKLTLRFINQGREALLLRLTKNLKDICGRAFDDLCLKAEIYHQEKLLALEREKVIEEMNNMRLSLQQQQPGSSNVSRLSGQQQTPIRLTVPQGTPTIQLGTLTVPLENPSVQQERAPTTPLPVEEETNKTATEITEANNEEAVMPADDRTVFLTFSKGYPISESEVRVYFTRRFGDVIEAILMQDVEGNEQPLFARMVLKVEYASKIEEIVTARNKNKFTINGKHVWVRKYIRKSPNSAAASSSSSHV